MNEGLHDRLKGAIWGVLIADALAMPTHWFYGGPAQVKQMYGKKISGYVAPVYNLPGSILNKSNTGGAGRGGYQGDVIGKVIFHNKKKYWSRSESIHYHQGMAAGDNTLEALLMRRVVAVMAKEKGEFVPSAIRQDYIKFMTTPDTHNETYCSTCHRMFFAKWAAGIEPELCPDNDAHNVDTVDALISTVPVALASSSDQAAVHDVAAVIAITRDSPKSQKYAAIFSKALRDVAIRGIHPGDAVKELGNANGLSFNSSTVKSADQLTACYLQSSFPAALMMIYKYAELNKNDSAKAFQDAVLANANRGGENVHGGAMIGAMLGAHCGFSNLPKDLVNNLAKSQRPALDEEIETLVSAIVTRAHD